MAKAMPKIGEINRYKQRLIAQTDEAEEGELPLWVLECERPDGASGKCGYRYGSNGVDFFQRKCPLCHEGAPGPSIAGTAYA